MSEQPTDDVVGSLRDAMRGLFSSATETATAIAQRRAEAARRAQAESDAAARAYRQRTDAQFRADEILMRPVWTDRWWSRVDGHPEKISEMWEKAAGWAQIQPYAQAVLHHMRDEIAERYGIELPMTPLRGELARLLAAPGASGAEPTLEQELAPAAGRVFSYQIFDAEGMSIRSDPAAFSAEVMVEEGTPLELFAAERFQAYARVRSAGQQSQAQLTGDEVIKVHSGANTITPVALTLTWQQAQEIHERITRRRQQILTGEQDAPPEEVRDALLAERRRLRAELDQHDPAVLRARHQLRLEKEAYGILAREAQPDSATTGSSAADPAHAQNLREELADIALRIHATEAQLRGEDPDQVYQSAMLRQGLDEGWWQTANPEEIAGVWGHVEQWDESVTRAATLERMRENMVTALDAVVNAQATRQEVLIATRLAEAKASGRTAFEATIQRPNVFGVSQIVRHQALILEPGEQPVDAARRAMNAWFGDVSPPYRDKYSISLFVPGAATSHVQNFTFADLQQAPDAEQAHTQPDDIQPSGDPALDTESVPETSPAQPQAPSPDTQATQSHVDSAAEQQRLVAAQLHEQAAAATLSELPDQEAAAAAVNARLGFPDGPRASLAKGRQRRSTASRRPPRSTIPERQRE